MRALVAAPPTATRLRAAGVPRLNLDELAMVAVAGEIVPPRGRTSPYSIGHDGVPRVLPGTGGIVLSHRVGDPCVGLAADHLEVGAALQCRHKALKGTADAANLAFNTYACIGNRALVLTGPCRDKTGVVVGKHGGVNHVLVDFPPPVLRRLRIGDRIQVYAHGLGMRLLDHPRLELFSCSPRLLQAWGLRSAPPTLYAPVTHVIPAAIMGSGLGRNNAARGDYDIQLSDPQLRRRLRLDRLRFGDLVAIRNADTRFGRAWHSGYVTVGVVIHGDSVKSGHGPGVVSLISGEARYLKPVRDERANLAAVLGIRAPKRALARAPYTQRHRPPAAGQRDSTAEALDHVFGS